MDIRTSRIYKFHIELTEEEAKEFANELTRLIHKLPAVQAPICFKIAHMIDDLTTTD